MDQKTSPLSEVTLEELSIVVQWLRNQPKQTKLAFLILNELIIYEEVLPGEHVGNVILNEYSDEVINSVFSSDKEFMKDFYLRLRFSE